MKKIAFLLIACIGSICVLQAQIKNIQAKTSLNNELQSGLLTLKVSLEQEKHKASLVLCKLTDPKGNVVLQTSHPLSSKTQDIDFQPQEIHQPILWNAESPKLYTLNIYLQKKNGTLLDHKQHKVAFRQVKMKGNEIWGNGQPIRIKGVNLRSLDQFPANHSWKKDVEQWKLHHVNAIRLSSTLPNTELYELCNQYGIYILNEQDGWDPTHPALREGCIWEWPNEDLPVKLEEMKKLYQDIRFFDFNRETGTVSIQNLHNFTRLNQYDFYYLIRDHGKEVYRNQLKNVDAAPGETITCTGLKGINLERNTTGDVRIEFYAKHRIPSPFFPKGSLAAREQTYIHTFFRPLKSTVSKPKMIEKKIETETTISFIGKELQLAFNKETGQMISYQYQGEEYLYQSQGLYPFFWRVPTPTDRLAHLPEILKAWKESSYQPLKASSFHYIQEKDETNIVKVTYRFPQTKAQWDITYKIYADGVLKIDNRFITEGNQPPMIPRVGLRMQLNPNFTTINYFGRGPRTNYRDCRTAQFLGEYSSAITTTTEACTKPQENGHRTDIYWCAIQGNLQGGMLLVADRTFEMNISNILLEDIENKQNLKTNLVDCFIDYRMMGIGADNRPGTAVQEPYLIRPGKENAIEYGFAIIPYKHKEDYKKLILKY